VIFTKTSRFYKDAAQISNNFNFYCNSYNKLLIITKIVILMKYNAYNANLDLCLITKEFVKKSLQIFLINFNQNGKDHVIQV